MSNNGHSMDRSTLREFSREIPSQTATDRLLAMINCRAEECKWWIWTQGTAEGRCGVTDKK